MNNDNETIKSKIVLKKIVCKQYIFRMVGLKVTLNFLKPL